LVGRLHFQLWHFSDLTLALEEALAEGGFEVAAVGSGEEAVTLLKGKATVIAHL
jgi:hypothetical protein